MSVWEELLVREPIDAMARRVVRQRKEVTPDTLTKPELAALLQRVLRKQSLLKRVLGITTRAQHKNAMWKFNKGFRQFRQQGEPRAFIEYKRLGEQALRFNEQLSVLRAERRRIAEQEAALRTQDSPTGEPKQ